MTRREKTRFLFLFPFVSIEYAWIFILAFTTTVRADDWAPVARMSIDSDEVGSEAVREEREREASA